MAGPFLPGLPYELCSWRSGWDGGESGLVERGQVEVFHPLTFRPWSLWGCRGFLAGRHRLGALGALGHRQVAMAEADRDGSIEPEFDSD